MNLLKTILFLIIPINLLQAGEGEAPAAVPKAPLIGLSIRGGVVCEAGKPCEAPTLEAQASQSKTATSSTPTEAPAPEYTEAPAE